LTRTVAVLPFRSWNVIELHVAPFHSTWNVAVLAPPLPGVFTTSWDEGDTEHPGPPPVTLIAPGNLVDTVMSRDAGGKHSLKVMSAGAVTPFELAADTSARTAVGAVGPTD
jgi:hypothetical protein